MNPLSFLFLNRNIVFFSAKGIRSTYLTYELFFQQLMIRKSQLCLDLKLFIFRIDFIQIDLTLTKVLLSNCLKIFALTFQISSTNMIR